MRKNECKRRRCVQGWTLLLVNISRRDVLKVYGYIHYGTIFSDLDIGSVEVKVIYGTLFIDILLGIRALMTYIKDSFASKMY